MKKILLVLSASLGFTLVAQSSDQPVCVLDSITHIKPIQQLILGYLQQWEQVSTFLPERRNYVAALAFAPHNTQLAAGYGNSEIFVWDLPTGKICKKYIGHESDTCTLKYSPDGMRLVSGAHEQNLAIWDRQQARLITKLPEHTFDVKALSFSPDQQYIAASSHKEVKIWDARSYKLLHTLRGHQQSVNAVIFAKDNSYLATASFDQTIRLWDTKTFTLSKEIPTTNYLLCLDCSPDSRYLISGSQSSLVQIWDTQTGSEVKPITPLKHGDTVDSIAYAPSGEFFASASSDQTVKIWHGKTGELLQTLPGLLGGASSVAIAPDSKTLAAGCYSGYIKVFKLRALANYI